jgi:hypothetical protein
MMSRTLLSADVEQVRERARSGNDAAGPAAGIDVVVPCYQYGHLLRGCVTSILTQRMDHIRVLIIDNASGDDSAEVAQELAAEDARVEVVARRRNLGLHASFNEGIDWASSAYFVVLCADDLLAPGALARAVAVMESHDEVAFAFGRAALVRPQDAMPRLQPDPLAASWQIVPGQEVLERFCRDGIDHVPGPSAVLARTGAQKRAGYYRSELPHSTDFEMWMRLARLGAVAKTEACQTVLRLHRYSRAGRAARDYTGARPPAMPWEDEAAFDSFFAHEGTALPDASRLHRLARRSVAERAYWAAVAHLCRGQFGAGAELLKFALTRRPSSTLLPPLSYLWRRDDAALRISEVLSGLVRWRRVPACCRGGTGTRAC